MKYLQRGKFSGNGNVIGAGFVLMRAGQKAFLIN
jgi:hypothetical protein